MIFRLSLALLTLVATLDGPALADDASKYGPPPLAFTATDEPKWLARVLRKLVEAKPWPIAQHLLLKRKGRTAFLAVVRQATSRDQPTWEVERVLELYRVRVISTRNIRLDFELELRDRFIAIEEPSGFDISRDGNPFLFISYGHGGSDPVGYGVRVYKLTGGVSDVTPRWAGEARRMIRLSSDFQFVLDVNDYRFNGILDCAGPCRPVISVLMKWERGQFRPACRHFSDYYLRETTKSEAPYPAKLDRQYFEMIEIYWDPWLFLIDSASDALNLLQAGKFEQAKAGYEISIAIARELGTRNNPVDQLWTTTWVGYAETNIRPVIETVMAKGRNLPCPLMAITGEIARERPDSSFYDRIEKLRPPGSD